MSTRAMYTILLALLAVSLSAESAQDTALSFPGTTESCPIHTALQADLLRRHRADHSVADAFAPTAENTKHTPFIAVTGRTARVTVGLGTVSGNSADPIHPTEAGHHITHIYAVDQNANIVAMTALLGAGGKRPSLTFVVPKYTTSVTAYAFCNLHGLHVSATVEVTETGEAPRSCGMTSCFPDGTGLVNGVCQDHFEIETEALRRQVAEFNRDTAFTPTADNTKHTPFVTLSGTRARVTVGLGTVSGNPNDLIHPTVGSGDPLLVHFIDVIYVKNQDGTVIAAGSMSPVGGQPVLEFEVPVGTTSVTAYAFCNTHGLHGSAVVQTPTTSVYGVECGAHVCAGERVRSARCGLFEAMRADVLRRHKEEYKLDAPFTLDRTDTSSKKHTPFFTVSGTTATVTVGIGTVTDTEEFHPTDPGHYVNKIYVVDQRGVVIAAADLLPTVTRPSLTFEVPVGTLTMQAVAHCTLHGAHASDVQTVTETTTHLAPCRVNECYRDEKGVENGVCTQFVAIEAEALRRQVLSHKRNTAFTPTADNTKHTPFVTLSGARARVTVGLGTVSGNPNDLIHPTAGSGDPLLVHFIDVIFVKNQDGTVIAAGSMSPVGGQPVLEFEVPVGTTSVTAYAFCNTHGLHGSAVVQTPTTGAFGLECGAHVCAGERVRSARCGLFEAMRADVLRRHKEEYKLDAPFTLDRTDTSSKKHTPFFTVSGTTATVTVGIGTVTDTEEFHPTDPGHYVNKIYVVDQRGVVIAAADLLPTVTRPSLTFDIPGGTGTMQAVAHCTLHGAHASDVQTVTETTTHLAPCRVNECYRDEKGVENGVCTQFVAIEAEALRRQVLSHKRNTAFTPTADNTKHTPFVTLSGTRARVTVGLGTVSGNPNDLIHPTVGSGDPLLVHFIDVIYVKNQDGTVIAAGSMSPVGGQPVLEFEVPVGTTSVTAYAFCNTHGLHGSAVVEIPAENVGGVGVRCGVDVCAGERAPRAHCPVFAARHAGLVAKHRKLTLVSEPFPPTSEHTKHTPQVRLYQTTTPARRTLTALAEVTVGLGTVSGNPNDLIHPTDTSTDAALTHFITTLYAVDQAGTIVAMQELVPSADASYRPRFVFAVPAGVRTLTAYSSCNRHGLYRGADVAVPAGYTTPFWRHTPLPCPATAYRPDDGSAALVSDAACGAAATNSRCAAFEVLRADALYWHGVVAPAAGRPYNILDAASVPAALKLVPTVTVRGTQGIVRVSAAAHSTNPDASDTAEAVAAVYVEDSASGEVVAAARFVPAASPYFSFTVPTGHASLVPFVSTVAAGLFRGTQLDVSLKTACAPVCSAVNASTEVLASAGVAVGIPPCPLYTALQADLLRRHRADHSVADAFAPTAENTKHTPFIAVTGRTARVTVGLGTVSGNSADPIHPTEAGHHITHIYAVDQNANIVAMTALLGAGGKRPSLTFVVPKYTTSVTAYAFCNLHGLHVSATVEVTETGEAPRSCGMTSCFPDGTGLVNGVCQDHFEIETEALRRQVAEFNRDTAFTPTADNTKHTPFVTLSGTRARVTVGLGTVSGNPNDLIHPTVGSGDPLLVHFIDVIYVKNQDGTVIAAGSMSPVGGQPVLEFEVPVGTTSVTAYAFCNTHGLHGSAVVQTPTTSVYGVECGAHVCAGERVRSARCGLFEAMRADVLRRHKEEYKLDAPFTLDRTDTSSKKHTPFFTVSGTTATVTVGIGTVTDTEEFHPTDPGHYVNKIYVVDQRGVVIAAADLLPTVTRPSLTFEVPVGTLTMQAVAHCTLHGAHASDVQTVTETTTHLAPCRVNECYRDEKGVENGVCTQFVAIEAEALRRQVLSHKRNTAFTPTADNTKHTPFVTLSGARARVTVGLGTVSGNPNDLIHPTAGSGDPLLVHFIDVIFVKNQDGTVIAAGSMSPVGGQPVLEFEVPVGTTSVTAYAFCNTHGLHGSAVVQTPTTGAFGLECGAHVCAGERVRSARCGLFEAMRADVLRRHKEEYKLDAPFTLDRTDTSSKKHTPFFTVSGTTATVTVGIGTVTDTEEFHPTDPGHYVNKIYVVDQRGVVIAAADLLPTVTRPSLTFDIPSGTGTMQAVAHCTLHGAHASDVQTVTETTTHLAPCRVNECYRDEKGVENGVCTQFVAIEAEALRRQVLSHKRDTAFTPTADNTKHTPFVTLSGTRARVTVGLGTVSGNPNDLIHPTVGSGDPLLVHFIDVIYVKNQDGTVIAAGSMSPVGGQPVLEFEVPVGTTSVTAYAFCNTHGLHGSAVVETPTSGPFTPQCGVSVCGGRVSGFQPCLDLEAHRAELLNQHARIAPGALPFYGPEVDTKHTPYLTVRNVGGSGMDAVVRATVTVGLGTVTGKAGDLVHPADEDHHIQTLFAVNQNDVIVALAEVGGVAFPSLSFDVPAGTRTLRAFSSCNTHGLYAGAVFAVPQPLATLATMASLKAAPAALGVCRARVACFAASAGRATAAAEVCPDYDVMRKDAVRTQRALHARDTPYAPGEAAALPASPVLRVLAGGLKVRVTAPQVQPVVSTDAASVSYVSTVYVEDAQGRVVAAKRFYPAQGPASASFEFFVPSAAASGSTLVPYALHNRGGLFRGMPVYVPATACSLLNCAPRSTWDVSAATGAAAEAPTFVRGVGSEATPAPPASCEASTLALPSYLAGGAAATYACTRALALAGASLHWTYLPGDSVVHIAVRSESAGWLGVSFPQNSGRMAPASAMIYSDGTAKGYAITAQSVAGVTEDPSVLTSLGVTTLEAGMANGATHVYFTRSTLVNEVDLFADLVSINVARDLAKTVLEEHSHSEMTAFALNFASATSVDFKVKDLRNLRKAHAWLMVSAFCLLMPFGVMFKRYGKPVLGLGNSIRLSIPGASFIMHVGLMIVACICAASAFGIAVTEFSDSDSTEHDPLAHNTVGYLLIGLTFVQPFIGLMAPLFCPKHNSPGRGVFKIVHPFVGVAILIIAFVQCIGGMEKLRWFGQEQDADKVQVVFVSAWAACIGGMIVGELIRTFYRVLKKRSGYVSSERGEERIPWTTVVNHDGPKDPWVVVDGKVYAVGSWMEEHPGGMDVLLSNAGTDASDVFWGFSHSEVARQRMKEYFVGEVEDERMMNVIALMEQIAASFIKLDLETAEKQILRLQPGDIPFSFVLSLRKLTSNLDTYIPFLPASIVETAQATEVSVTEGLRKSVIDQHYVDVMFERDPPEVASMVFTDIQSSTMLWEVVGTSMRDALMTHNNVLRRCAASNKGYEVKTIGDAFMVAFRRAADAVSFALEAQEELVEESWPERLLQEPLCAEQRNAAGEVVWRGIRIRIGIHHGEVDPQLNPITSRYDFFGSTVNKAARLEGVAVGGTVAVSEEVLAEVSMDEIRATHGEVSLTPMGRVPLKGVGADSQVSLLLPGRLESRRNYVMSEMLKKRTEREKPNKKGRSGDKEGSVSSATGKAGEKRSSVGTSIRLAAAATRQAVPYATALGTALCVQVDWNYLLAWARVPRGVDSLFITILDLCDKNEGHFQSILGSNLLLTWNVTRKCPQQIIQSIRFACVLHDAGWGMYDNETAWGSSVAVGASTSWFLNGRSGTERQKQMIVLGPAVDVARQAAEFAAAQPTFFVYAAIPGITGYDSDNTVTDQMRLVDVWTADRPVTRSFAAEVTKSHLRSPRMSPRGVQGPATPAEVAPFKSPPSAAVPHVHLPMSSPVLSGSDGGAVHMDQLSCRLGEGSMLPPGLQLSEHLTSPRGGGEGELILSPASANTAGSHSWNGVCPVLNVYDVNVIDLLAVSDTWGFTSEGPANDSWSSSLRSLTKDAFNGDAVATKKVLEAAESSLAAMKCAVCPGDGAVQCETCDQMQCLKCTGLRCQKHSTCGTRHGSASVIRHLRDRLLQPQPQASRQRVFLSVPFSKPPAETLRA